MLLTITARCGHRFIMVALVAGALLATASDAQEHQFRTVIEVKRILTEVRVVDHHGYPVPNLGPEDFRVRINGTPAEVESISWIPSTADTADSPYQDGAFPEQAQAPSTPPTEGRLVVLFFQTDIGLRYSRTVGLVRIAPFAADFVRSLGPEDRVAVLVFRSHLELRCDFTTDHEAVAEMLGAKEVLTGKMIPPMPSEPSMAEYFNTGEAKKAATMSRALEVTANALGPIAGTKSLILYGLGIGRMTSGWQITVGSAYSNSMAALSAARTSVFSLDITDADYHSLERGLRRISEDTGGFYIKTNIFPEIATKKLARVISSYYELSIKPPPDLKGSFKIKVKVDRPGTEVYVRQHHPP